MLVPTINSLGSTDYQMVDEAAFQACCVPGMESQVRNLGS